MWVAGLVLLIAGIVLGAVGDSVVGFAMGAVGAVVLTSWAFLLIGESEDRDRERGG